MHVYFARTLPGHPDPICPLVDTPNSWRIYEICKQSHRHSSLLRVDIGNATSLKDKSNFRTSLINFVEKAHIGKPLRDMYDEKQCHEAHEYKRASNHQSVTIPRIWGTGQTRIYFVYAPNRVIVILKIDAKRKDKLSTGEKDELRDLAELVFKTLDQYEFDERVIK